MSEAESKKEATYFPQMERVRHLALIPPPVPLRCVLLWLFEGQVRQEEEVVVGLQATVADAYGSYERGVRQPGPRPRTPRPADLLGAGWQLESGGGNHVCYDVVIWDFEAHAPRALDADDLSNHNWERLVAPAAADWWWRAELAAAAERLRSRCEPPEAS